MRINTILFEDTVDRKYGAKEDSWIGLSCKRDISKIPTKQPLFKRYISKNWKHKQCGTNETNIAKRIRSNHKQFISDERLCGWKITSTGTKRVGHNMVRLNMNKLEIRPN